MPDSKPAYLDQLDLSVRARNCLRRNGIISVDQLLVIDDNSLLKIRGMGESTIAELRLEVQNFLMANPSHKPSLSQNAAVDPDGSVMQEISIGHLLSDSGALLSTPDDIKIDALHLSTRTKQALLRGKILYVRQLATKSTTELLDIKNLGGKALEEIQQCLEDFMLNKAIYEKSSDELLKDVHEVITEMDSYPLLHNKHYLLLPLQEISVVRLALPTRTLIYLRSKHVNTVFDMLKRKSILLDLTPLDWQYAESYLDWLVQNQETWTFEIQNKGINPFQTRFLRNHSIELQITDWLSVVNERQREVIAQRYGLFGTPLTLEEVGCILKLTRERVRQLQKVAERILLHHLFCIRPLIFQINQVITKNGWVMSLSELMDQMWISQEVIFGKIEFTGVIDLLSGITTDIVIAKSREFVVVLPYSLSDVAVIQKRFRRLLNKNMVPTPINELVVECQALKDSDEPVIPKQYLLACINTDPEIEILEDDLVALTKWANRRTDKIIVALRTIGKPAHFSTICEYTNALLPEDQQTTAHNLHAQIGRLNDIFVRVGHGIFGLVEWGLHDDGNVANAAVRVLENAGYPLHIDAITSEVLRTWDVNTSSVYAAVQQDERIIGIGNGVFYLRSNKGFVDQTATIEHVGFGDLFGDQISKWQDELGFQQMPGEFDTTAEVDRIREIGLDFFSV